MYLFKSFSCASRSAGFRSARNASRPVGVAGKRAIVCRAAGDDELGTPALAAAVAGLVANPICLWSEYTLKTTGSGLPPGPGGALGAAEGVSYLVIVGLVAWSLYTKQSTGSGLPAGPSGILGAAEGFSYLSLLAGIIVFALNSAGI